MKKYTKKFIQVTVGYLILLYLKKDRFYTYNEIKILVKKDVFHPGFFFSTKFLLSSIKTFELTNKKVLELGAGSGIISFYCDKKGANVTSSDISPIAINGLIENNKKLKANVTIIESDLFDKIPTQVFDFIIINPPYYPKKPNSDSEKAWYCGENFEYFEKLFKQLNPYNNGNAIVFLSLSEDCDFYKIASIASKNNFLLEKYLSKMILWERNFIYKVMPK
ncbi:MAG: methyltransferase [Bacteroidota bacterium]|jgi:release factor glutamine methyltransferase